MDAGDVILIEQQGPVCAGVGPGEGDIRTYRAIERATDNGITVVEAAGDGAMDLDDPRCNGVFRRSYDSGAIIVAAGTAEDRRWLSFSSYGSRVDLQGWGERVTTTGYGDLFGLTADRRQRYTAAFKGTSSAASIVAGAVLVIQGILAQSGRPPLRPRQMRDLLVSTGTPQFGSSHHIGPLPNIPSALERLGVQIP